MNNGKCVDKNCLAYTADEICASCVTGYKINSNGNCEFSDPNCQTFTNGKCDVCIQGYYASAKGSCFKLPSNCMYGNVIT